MTRLEYMAHFETLPLAKKTQHLRTALQWLLASPALRYRHPAFRRGAARSIHHVNIVRHSFKA